MGNNDFGNSKINDINVENPDLFLNLLDKKAKLEKNDEDLFPKVLKNKEIDEEASRSNAETGKMKRDKARKSSQTNIPTSKKGKKPASKVIRDNWKGFVLGSLSAVIIISTASRIKSNIQISEKVEVGKNAAMEICEKNGLTTTNEDGETVVLDFSNNGVVVSGDDPVAVRAYYEALDRDNEQLNNFVVQIVYENGKNHFVNLRQYLTYGGFVDHYDGTPSMDEFMVYTNNIYKNMSDEDIKESLKSSLVQGIEDTDENTMTENSGKGRK